MASVEELSAAVTPVSIGLDGVRRTRELYRYLTPASLSSTPAANRTADSLYDASNLTPSLIPFVQLVALRCNTTKAIVNVIDTDTMYFLAQVSKRTEEGSQDSPMFETSEDSVLMGCSKVPVSGRVCELTIRMHSEKDCKFPMFIVPDMSKDPRFATLDVVAGGPKYKFYAGTPIITKEGVNIGSLAVMDTQPRTHLTFDEEHCLGETAAHIMGFLELNREAIEGRQARRMGCALNAFVTGKKSLHDDPDALLSLKRRSTANSYGIADHLIDPSSTNSQRSARSHSKRNQQHNGEGSSGITPSPTDSECETSDVSARVEDTGSQAETEELDSRSHSRTFARAANLIREALELGDEGGVLFVSVSATSSIPTLLSDVQAGVDEDSTSTSEDVQPEKVANAKLAELIRSPSFMKHSKSIPASTLASSVKASPLLEGDITPGQGSMKLDSEVVDYFVGRYPNGRLWLLEENGSWSSSEETAQEIKSQKGTKSSRTRRRAAELEFLRRAFPDARQLLLNPLWDPTQGRISSACFVWSSTSTRLLTMRHELSYLTSFCQTLMAECSRLDAMMSDKQKSDFVGTISHELRSPLHGILASVEFLGDSDLTSFQESIIQTIDSCGKTLLDTINHVLDFSKINSFEKNWEASNRHKDKTRMRARSTKPNPLGGSTLAASAPPLLQLFGATDISTVLEEVVEGIIAGQNYNHSLDLTDTSRAARGRSQTSMAITDERVQVFSESDAVEIILDVDPGNWVFTTQPGALRRIMMNVFGNALKYTTHGSVKVRLELRDENTMVLTVTDTGKGISPKFLNSRLFMPFAQENALAPGTGLGLSICKSIVTMLGGSIDVRSRVNAGTTVQVSLPLVRPDGANHSMGGTPHSRDTSASSAMSTPDKTIPEIKNHAEKYRVALFHSTDADQHLAMRDLSSVLEKYITQWYGLQLVQIESALTNIVLLEEQDLQRLITQPGVPLNKLCLIVLCSSASRRQQVSTAHATILRHARFFEYLAKPCGPQRLAKKFKACLDKLDSSEPGTLTATPGLPTPQRAPDISDAVNDLTLGKPSDTDRIVVHATEVLSASQTSQHAQHAIMNPGSGASHTLNGDDSFPFPSVAPSTPSPSQSSRRPTAVNQSSPGTLQKLTPSNGSYVVTPMPQPLSPPPLPVRPLDPRMLIVDDNAINLKLLHTFLRKQKYSNISSAENGAVAVELFTAASQAEPYQVVFMDVSMPVMNGFEATRAIRDFEERKGVKNAAMIIALTGLASGKDQAEGFASGCDIYLTKPVSFKEVGRLLDNWATNQKRDANGHVLESVPDGGVSEMGLQSTSNG